ncbi:hypothetical protein GCM10017779_08990 [Streptomyces capillispiralis]|nr:hypothetical protein GCM10017779_08990 [Streptomyces capillispiralis]
MGAVTGSVPVMGAFLLLDVACVPVGMIAILAGRPGGGKQLPGGGGRFRALLGHPGTARRRGPTAGPG